MNYEYQMRKEVVEEMNQGGCMAEELKKITKNSDVRERHFSTPLAVSSASQAVQAGWTNQDGAPTRVHPYGGPKGKGKGKKGKGKKGKKGQAQQQLHSTTPDAASLGITSRRAAKEDVKGSMHAGSAWIPLIPLSRIPREMPGQRGRQRLLDYLRKRRSERFHSPGFCGCSICLQAQTERPVSRLP